MNIQIRKLGLIEEFIRLNDEDLITIASVFDCRQNPDKLRI